MPKSKYSIDERFSMIMDCYQSGNTIIEWCKSNDIAPGTFYSWIRQVKNYGYDAPELNEFKKQRTFADSNHEIVKVGSVNSITNRFYPETLISTLAENSNSKDCAVSIDIGVANIRISSDIDETLLTKIFRTLRAAL